MMERIKYKLKEFDSKTEVNKDFYVKVGLFGEQMLLPQGDINHIVDVGKQFDKERRESTIFRIKGTITPVFSNPLMNMLTTSTVPGKFGAGSVSESGNGLDIFNYDIFRLEPFANNYVGLPELTFEDAYKSKLLEKDGWFGFSEPDTTKMGVCTYYDIEPTRDRFDLSSYGDKNWELTITYPARKEITHDIVVGGLKVVGALEVEVGGVPMVAIASATYHGLENGNKVRLSSMTHNSFNGDFTVQRKGLDNGDFKDNYFVIDVDPSVLTTSPIINGRMKKLVSGMESEYYVRVFKKLMQKDGDYEMYQLAFSNNVYNDPNYQFIINEDIDIDGLEDNLGRPLSELYLTMIKTNSNGMFHSIQSGFDLEFLPGNLGSGGTVSNVRQIHYGPTSQVPLENAITISSSNEFYGDIVEYNKFTLRETVLSDVMHRFNTYNREMNYVGSIVQGPRREGYIYNPHHKIKIREFSVYEEQGDSSTDGIPSYAEDLGDGRFLWRDLLDVGIYDGEGDLLDYPFTNGAHYLHQNFCFKTMRQDPFSAYGLYYTGSPLGAINFDPSDPIGDSITDVFIVRRSDDVC